MPRFKLTPGYTHRELKELILEADSPEQLKEMAGAHVVNTTGKKLDRLRAVFTPPEVRTELENECRRHFFLDQDTVHPALRDLLYRCGHFLNVTFRGRHFEYLVHRLQ